MLAKFCHYYIMSLFCFRFSIRIIIMCVMPSPRIPAQMFLFAKWLMLTQKSQYVTLPNDAAEVSTVVSVRLLD